MSLLHELEEAFHKYFQDIFSGLKLDRSETYSSGPGVILTFRNENLKVRLVNEWGLLGTEISAVQEENYFHTDLINLLLNLEEIKNLNLGQFARMQLFAKRLDLKEQAKFIYDHWTNLVLLFDPQNLDATKEKLANLGWERA